MKNIIWIIGFILALLFCFSGCSTNSASSPLLPDNPVIIANAKPTVAPTITPIQLATSAPAIAPVPTTVAESGVENVEEIEPQAALNCPQPELVQAGRLCFVGGGGETFVHPVSMVSNGQMGWLIDGGRVLQIDLVNGGPSTVLIVPGTLIEDEPVQEPLDLALVDLASGPNNGLLVLDRVGDVYLHDLTTGVWSRDRYARPIGQTSSHYYLALSSNGSDRYLLEASYRYGVRYLPNEGETGWSVDEDSVLVDLAVLRGSAAAFAYILQRPIDSPNAEILRYVQGQVDGNFRPNITITQPREIQVGPRAVYLLDRGGLRLSVLNNENGTLLSQTEFQFPISTFALYLDEFGSSVGIYAGRNTIYLPGKPEIQQEIDMVGQPAFMSGTAPYDPQIWDTIPQLILPLENLPPDARELRLPGAPRHYRQGIHEGMDFYWGPGRQIRAVAAGTVIRAMHDYQEPWPELFSFYRGQAALQGQTTDEGLDFFRGRQIWLQHENGFVSRHAHLSSIDPNVFVGAQVTTGQIIGRVGNSGSPGSLDGPDVDSHLHFEIWYGDAGYLGQYWRPIETRELIEALFIP